MRLNAAANLYRIMQCFHIKNETGRIWACPFLKNQYLIYAEPQVEPANIGSCQFGRNGVFVSGSALRHCRIGSLIDRISNKCIIFSHYVEKNSTVVSPNLRP